MWLLFYVMSKKVKVHLKNGEQKYFEIIDTKIDYPIMISDADNYLSAELDLHKMRIFYENYYPVYNDGNKIISMHVSQNNVMIGLLRLPTDEETLTLMRIWSGKMRLGYCGVEQSKLFV